MSEDSSKQTKYSVTVNSFCANLCAMLLASLFFFFKPQSRTHSSIAIMESDDEVNLLRENKSTYGVSFLVHMIVFDMLKDGHEGSSIIVPGPTNEELPEECFKESLSKCLQFLMVMVKMITISVESSVRGTFMVDIDPPFRFDR